MTRDQISMFCTVL